MKPVKPEYCDECGKLLRNCRDCGELNIKDGVVAPSFESGDFHLFTTKDGSSTKKVTKEMAEKSLMSASLNEVKVFFEISPSFVKYLPVVIFLNKDGELCAHVFNIEDGEIVEKIINSLEIQTIEWTENCLFLTKKK